MKTLYTPDLWEHSSTSSLAKYKHVELIVTNDMLRPEDTPIVLEGVTKTVYDLLWKWRVSWTDPEGIHATKSGLAVDRIGACAEAEDAAHLIVWGKKVHEDDK